MLVQAEGMRSPIVEDCQVTDMQEAASRLVDLQHKRAPESMQPRSLAAVARSVKGAAQCAPTP